MRTPLLLLSLILLAPLAAADGPADNQADKVRPVPPPGLKLAPADRQTLEQNLTALEDAVKRLRGDARASARLPDVEIFSRAVRIALTHDEFFEAEDLNRARRLLTEGRARADRLAKGETPWLDRPGPTALGYVSRLDGSVQPYGLFFPDTFRPASPVPWRLDAWFHGRQEKLSEIAFLDGVLKGGGLFVRPDALVLQPYGRYCNGSKFAGEVDFFEALADVRRRVRVDPDRISVRGFSLGGASVWHLAAHHASDWAAAAPGAGFSETPEFLRVFQNEKLAPPWWEQKLWQLYDAPPYAENFRNVSLVAYSGEVDKQKQAADLMAATLQKIGVPLVHVIGPNTAHKYHPDSIVQINEIVDELVRRGREPLPRRVSLVTPTLKYPRQAWINVDGLGRHWDRASVQAELIADQEVRLTTSNVTALSLNMPSGRAPFPAGVAPRVRLDGQALLAPPARSDRSFQASFHRVGARWVAGRLPDDGEPRKVSGLQGPIDDAFMSPFLVVLPSQPSRFAPAVSRWTEAEQQRFVREWRRHFRGEARVKRDVDVSADDIAAYNLILWGDPSSNRLLAQLTPRLPIRWDSSEITVGKRRYPADAHALIAIYPNPLHPRRYIVLNSGFTFREYDYLNNARQTPKLPDWAVVDLNTPPNSRFPGRIADAGFFDERWRLP